MAGNAPARRDGRSPPAAGAALAAAEEAGAAPPASPGRQGRVVANSSTSMAAQILAMAIGLWFTPFLVHRLGVEVYGIIPLTLLVVSYFSLVTNAVNVFVGRDFSTASATNDRAGTGRIYSTAFALNFAMGGILMALGFGLAPLAPYVFRVPAGWESQAQWLFAATAVGFFLTCLATASSSVLFGHNRLDLRAGISVVSNLVRVGTVVWAFWWWGPSLHWMSVAVVAAALAALVGYAKLARRLERDLTFRWKSVSAALAKSYFREGGWVLVNHLGTIFYLKIDLLVVNGFLGAAASGRYALALQWSNVLRTLSDTITVSFAPTIMMRAGLGDRDGMADFARQAIRLTGVFLALVIGGLCGFARPLLAAWLGQEYVDLAPLLVVLTAHLAVNIAVSPLFAVQVAVGKVKVPGLVTFGMGLLNLLLALAAAGPLRWGAMGVAGAGAVVLLAKNALFTPVYAAAISGQKWHVFLRDVLRVVGATAGVGAVALAVGRYLDPAGWLPLIGCGVLTALLCMPWLWWLYFTSEDRGLARAWVRRFVARRPDSGGAQ
jgi:membrane protein EpsK